ncbi:MAG: tetratricopeptide repeat protein [Bacteroidota bacterium]
MSFLTYRAQEDTLVAHESEDTVVTTIEDIPNNALTETDLKGPMDAHSVEKISYSLYLNKQWQQLSDYCERAIKMDFDYYYLRVRAGVAWFELGKYRRAVVHFKKALEFNQGDDFANSYLYYSYLYSERFEDAKWLTKSFSPALSTSLFARAPGPVDFVVAESGIKVPDSSRQFKNALFSHIGINHSITKRLFLFHGFTYFAQNEQRFSVRQFQYYLKATSPLKNGFLLSAGFHVVNANADVRNFVSSVKTNTYLVFPIGPPGMPPPPPQVLTVTTTAVAEQVKATRAQNYVGAITLTRRTRLADYSIGATLGSFDTTKQVQLSAGINLYPFAHNKFSVGGTIYLHSEKDFKKKLLTLAPAVNIYLTNKIHLSVSYLYNEGPNISENTGSFVSNSVDYTPQRITFTTSVDIANGLWLYGTYTYEQKKHLAAGYKYDYNIFVVGIKVIPR